MLERIHITNFRRFRELEVPRATRINVITGSNNAGKTSLLEAIFLLSSGGNPTGVNIGRDLRGLVEDTQKPAAVREILWKPMFSALDTGTSIKIAADHAESGSISVRISLGENGEAWRDADAPASNLLKMQYFRNDEQVADNIYEVDHKGVKFKSKQSRPGATIPFSTRILLPYLGTTGSEAAHLLGVLRQRKRGDLVLKALQVIEPRLQSIEDNSASGSPMIWADIGLSELVPLPVMGGGMVRIASLVLAMATDEGEVFLVDEIENGIHHAVLADVWRVIDDMSTKLGTQVFATTHSYECLRAAASAVEGDDLSIHRLEIDGDETRCVTLDRSQIDGVIEYGMEVR